MNYFYQQHKIFLSAGTLLVLQGVFGCNGPVGGEDSKSELSNYGTLVQLIGSSAIMDSSITQKVLEGPPGQKYPVDENGNGKINVIYLIDNASRHSAEIQPLLVKIVDEDGDMDENVEGDYDSDLYIADWNGDGTIDRAIDYLDLDADNDKDEQYLYGFGGNPGRVVWAKDYGDDNRLWSDINYEHNQPVSEWKDDFNGDEMFVAYLETNNAKTVLEPNFEIAFSFYDNDGDTYSEEAVRFEGKGRNVKSLRYSMDIDNGNSQNSPVFHDYDFSITALGDFQYPSSVTTEIDLRGIPARPIVPWNKMRDNAKAGEWTKTLLSWVENDANVAFGHPLFERWEGVINHESEYFPGIGAPPVSPFNVRNEVDRDNSGQFKFYWSDIDHRFHLLGAELGWIKVDYNYDNQIDMVIWMIDKDGNGYFDYWSYDIDGDKEAEYLVNREDNNSTAYSFDYAILRDQYQQKNDNLLSLAQNLNNELKEKLSFYGPSLIPDNIEVYFENDLPHFQSAWNLGKKISTSSMGKRYYYDLIRIHYWYQLMQSPFIDHPKFDDLKENLEKGNWETALQILRSINLGN